MDIKFLTDEEMENIFKITLFSAASVVDIATRSDRCAAMMTYVVNAIGDSGRTFSTKNSEAAYKNCRKVIDSLNSIYKKSIQLSKQIEKMSMSIENMVIEQVENGA